MASGDLKYEEVVQVTLTAQQRTDLGNLIAQLWPGALADLASATFYRIPGGNTIGCSLVGEQTKAPSLVPLGVKITGRVP